MSSQASPDPALAKDLCQSRFPLVLLAIEDRNCCHLPPGSSYRLWELEESFYLQGNEMMGAPIFQRKLREKEDEEHIISKPLVHL